MPQARHPNPAPTTDAHPGPLASLLFAACAHPSTAERNDAFAEVLDLLHIYVRAAMGRALRSNRESTDVCQSIARSLAADLAHDRLDFPTPAHLRAYLKQVVRTKLALLARTDATLKRGGHHTTATHSSIADPPANSPTPSQSTAAAESLDAAHNALPPDLQEVALLRARGLNWDQIAAATGRPAPALRQQWSRATRDAREQ
jgi:DNA-directed RNA polymerase specialized sigma24 family protein